MKKCSYCKNSIRDAAVYCDNCGKLLKNNIEINYDKDFNKLLIDLSKLINRNKDGLYGFNAEIENLIDLFWYYMFKYSNIENVLEKEKISLNSIANFPNEICYELKKSSNKNIFPNFVHKFNDKFLSYISKLNSIKYTFYYLTNIDEKNIGELKIICGLFDLEVIS